MGRGSYTSADWSKLRHSGKISDTASANQIFTNRSMPDKFNPRYIERREARDSEDHPVTTAVMIGLDVTGSMGYLSEKIAKEGLHKTMTRILDTHPIEGPQLLFAAIGDVTDRAPLQVTQFESDIRIAEQLLELWLEGMGGDAPEDYELLWYFAANHVSADCFEKHQRKGLIFTIGDADCHPMLKSGDIRRIFGDDCPAISSVELARQAGQKFEVFHIHLCSFSIALPVNLREALPGHVMTLDKSKVGALPEIITTVMHMVGGMPASAALALCDPLSRQDVKAAIGNLVISDTSGGISF